MSKNKEIAKLTDQYVMNTYSRAITIVRGQGCKVWDADGMVYLDFTSGIAVQALGHCNPAVVQAIQSQAETLTHCSNLFYTPNQALLAQKLSQISLGGKCFFCNSGAEANEAMIKLARLWGHREGRYEIVTMWSSFHGRTLATAAATAQSKIQAGFEPLPAGFAYAELNNIESVRAAINEKTVAIMLEPIQGEGGVHPVTPEFAAALRELCDEKNLLLLDDDVQCGVGRTGNWFGWQTVGLQPDAFSCAKAIAGGLPMGVLVASPKLSDVFQPGNHGSTFGGNPVACAAALATLKEIEDNGITAHAAEMGDLLRDSLQAFVEQYPEHIVEVRGVGLLNGLVFDCPVKPIIDRCRKYGLLLLSAGENVIRFLPPLTITERDLEEALEILGEVLEEAFAEKAE